eukprot:TRINITY_DN35457_c0_g1_i1.p1 TRINITY_DN35457_c0_g1~~TRINITY_DN35457_c0_g1_i1.p1  ORF type:complete len:362 (-),score=109.66 TRINITY_DN35457_c0_g1_i1:181-1137(-)
MKKRKKPKKSKDIEREAASEKLQNSADGVPEEALVLQKRKNSEGRAHKRQKREEGGGEGLEEEERGGEVGGGIQLFTKGPAVRMIAASKPPEKSAMGGADAPAAASAEGPLAKTHKGSQGGPKKDQKVSHKPLSASHEVTGDAEKERVEKVSTTALETKIKKKKGTSGNGERNSQTSGTSVAESLQAHTDEHGFHSHQVISGEGDSTRSTREKAKEEKATTIEATLDAGQDVKVQESVGGKEKLAKNKCKHKDVNARRVDGLGSAFGGSPKEKQFGATGATDVKTIAEETAEEDRQSSKEVTKKEKMKKAVELQKVPS